MTNEQLWQAILGELELTLSRPNFTTWFKNTFIYSITDDQAIVGVPNTFTKTWLEKKYHQDIIKILEKLTENKIKKVIYQVEINKPQSQELFSQPTATAENKPKTEAESLPSNENAKPTKNIATEASKAGLNPRYILETFIVGKTNELAHAAAFAAIKNPGQTYNPLFIYGGVGLGKTHLMQAIGHEILRANPQKRIIYVTCEKFTNDFIKSIQGGSVDSFKKNYRSPDVLLVDDIQFLAGKEGTQEEFFHTFNALHQENKQIVITSDRPPKAIPALEERLISRFEWGLIADIGLPDLEMRLAILESKCKEKNYHLDPTVLQYIATNIYNSIRELEGALNKIYAFVEINKMEPTLDNVKKILSSLNPSGQKKKSITPKDILNIICDFFDVSLSELIGPCREKKLVGPRQIAMYLMRKDLQASFPGIGQEMGGRDHTTAMHACSKVGRDIENDERVRQEIHLIRQRLYQ